MKDLTPDSFSKLELEFDGKNNLSDQLYDLLLDAILSTKLPPNSKLVLSHLSDELKVSMTPLREALKRLYKEGLVSYSKNIGYKVLQYGKKEIEDVFYYRYTLEKLAIEYASEKISPEKSRNLLMLAERIDEQVQLNHGERILEVPNIVDSDLAFHRYLVYCSDNPYIIKEYDNLMPKIRYVRKFIERSDASATSFAEEHYLIYLLLRTGNPRYASEALHHHLYFFSYLENNT